ncbi:hypothetical protein HDU96_009376, partial [Phlyctochytrium bullatum]
MLFNLSLPWIVLLAAGVSAQTTSRTVAAVALSNGAVAGTSTLRAVVATSTARPVTGFIGPLPSGVAAGGGSGGSGTGAGGAGGVAGGSGAVGGSGTGS